MAGWLDKPRQFNSFTPEVDDDLYQKSLQKKEYDYQTGVQRVIAQDQAVVAALPILNDNIRAYATQKHNAIINQINSQTGTDWSDRNIQRVSSTAIGAIADDPIIQHAVGQTALARQQVNAAMQGKEDSDGQDIANQWYFNKDHQAYITSTDPNANYNAKYLPHMDTEKWGFDIVKEIKPTWRKYDNPADPKKGPVYQQWSKVTNMWEEVPEYEVRNVMELAIRNNPQAADQLHVNAQYTMKDYTPVHYVQHQAQVYEQQITANNKYSEELTSVKNGLKDAPSNAVDPQGKPLTGEALQAWIEEKQKEFALTNQELSHKLMGNIVDASQNFSAIKDQLYKDSYINEMVARVSGRKKESMELTGDPYDRLMTQRNYELASKKEQRDAAHQQWLEGHGNDEFAWDKYKFGIEHPNIAATLSTERTDSSILNTPVAAQTNAFLELNRKNYNDINHFLYYNLHDDKQVGELFAVNKGQVTAKNQDKANALMQQYYTAVLNGQPRADHSVDGTINGHTVNIPANVVNQVSDIAQNTRYGKLLHDNMQADEAEFAKSNANLLAPIIAALPSKLPAINAHYHTNYTKKDVDVFLNLAGSNKDLVNDIKALSQSIYNPEFGQTETNSVDVQAMYRKYGKGDRKLGQQIVDHYYNMYNIPEIRAVVDPNQEILNKRAEFFNEKAKDRGFAPVGIVKDLTIGDTKADPLTRSRIAGLQDVKDARKDSDGKIIEEALTESGAGTEHKIQATIKNDQHVLTFSNKKGETRDVVINDPSVIQEFFGNIPRPYRNFFNGIVMASKYKSSYTNGQPNWKEGTLVSRDPKTGLEIKKGLTYDNAKGGYWMHTYSGNSLSNAKEISNQYVGSNLDEQARLIDEERKQNGIIQ